MKIAFGFILLLVMKIIHWEVKKRSNFFKLQVKRAKMEFWVKTDSCHNVIRVANKSVLGERNKY